MEIVIIVVIVIFVLSLLFYKDSKNKPVKKTPTHTMEDIRNLELQRKYYNDFTKAEDDLKPVYLVLDTDSNGYPFDFKASYKDVDNWPELMAISWLLFNKDKELIREEHHVLKLAKKEISDSDMEFNGYLEDDIINGEDSKEVFDKLIADLKQADFIVCHNSEYHLTLLKSNFHRRKIPLTQLRKKAICTMKETRELVAIWSYSKEDFKYPKLSELVTKLFFKDQDPEYYQPDRLIGAKDQSRAVAKSLFFILDNYSTDLS